MNYDPELIKFISKVDRLWLDLDDLYQKSRGANGMRLHPDVRNRILDHAMKQYLAEKKQAGTPKKRGRKPKCG